MIIPYCDDTIKNRMPVRSFTGQQGTVYKIRFYFNEFDPSWINNQAKRLLLVINHSLINMCRVRNKFNNINVLKNGLFYFTDLTWIEWCWSNQLPTSHPTLLAVPDFLIPNAQSNAICWASILVENDQR